MKASMKKLQAGVVLLTASICATANSQQPTKTPSSKTAASAPPAESWITGRVVSSRLSDTVKAYVGEGDDLYAHAPGGEIGTIVRPTHDGKESGTYFGGEIRVSDAWIIGVSGLGDVVTFKYPCSDCTLLFVSFEFKNVSTSTHIFNPLQIELLGGSAALVAAASSGSYVFGKPSAVWDKLRKLPEINTGGKFDAGETWQFNYVFRVSRAPSALKLTYHGTALAQVSPERR